MHATAETALPRWDTSNIYSGLEGADYHAAVAELSGKLARLEALFDERQIRRGGAVADDGRLVEVLVQTLAEMNAYLLLAGTLQSFVYAFVSTNSYNSLAAKELSKLELLAARGQKLSTRLQAWIGDTASRWRPLLDANQELALHAFYLRDAAHRSQYLMSQELEDLAADLVLDSGVALGKLQGNVTSQLKVVWQRDGRSETLPITMIRNLSYDPDPLVRERAYRAELTAWESVRTTVAACLNGVKGTALTLARHRGRPSVLDVALDDNHIDLQTLEAMLSAIREALPTFRRYLQAKAGKLGLPRLRWWDLFAPLASVEQRFGWSDARDFIVARFREFSNDLGQYAELAFDGRWIDAQPRDGKRGGAFCMEVWGVEQSRILANFDGSFEQVSTLAHELGHGYHNHCQRELPALLRGAPMTLAETASIFCETLVAEGALAAAGRQQQAAILEAQLCGATQVCLDIYSRFLFESEVFARRGQAELSADEFCQLMLKAQEQTYADAVDPATYHPYMWLWKPHYYAHEHNFYNFPYAFGHLFALGLLAVFRREGEAFVPRYRQLLRSTAQDHAAPLAARFGIDITRPDFWRESLGVIARQVERFEAL